jgi:MFS family permease
VTGPPTDRGATVAPPWSALSFRWLLAGRVTSVLGNAVAPVALAFAVLDLTGSPTDLGLVLAARSIANVALLLMGGVFADRLPRSVLLSGRQSSPVRHRSGCWPGSARSTARSRRCRCPPPLR